MQSKPILHSIKCGCPTCYHSRHQATGKQVKLCLQMIEAHWNSSNTVVHQFSIHRGKGSSWSPNKRAKSKIIKVFRDELLNNEWTKYQASCFIKEHFEEFIRLVWRLTPYPSM